MGRIPDSNLRPPRCVPLGGPASGLKLVGPGPARSFFSEACLVGLVNSLTG